MEGDVGNFSSLLVKSSSNTAACLTLDPVTLNATSATCLSSPPLPATQGFIIHCNPWWCDPQGGICLSCAKAAFCGECAAGWYVTLLGQCSTRGWHDDNEIIAGQVNVRLGVLCVQTR